MTKKKVAKQRIRTGTGLSMQDLKFGGSGSPIFVDMPPRTPKVVFEAAKKLNGPYSLQEVDKTNFGFSISFQDDDHVRTDEDFPSTFQDQKDHRDSIRKWIKKNITKSSKNWGLQIHEKGWWTLDYLQAVRKPNAWTTFVKLHMSSQMKKTNNDHGKAMKIIGAMWKKKKSTIVQSPTLNKLEREASLARRKEISGAMLKEKKELADAEFFADEAPVQEDFSKSRQEDIPRGNRGFTKGTWNNLVTNIIKKYGVGGFKDTSASVVGNSVLVIVPQSQVDRLGKNLSSQVAKFKKRHNATFKTRMDRIRVQNKRVKFVVARL